ncbi:MAG: amidohydrolase family protein [Chitinophagaceae bacterium]|nr:amidohydrolase family protein [Chitinophagaceae bacterium]MCW5906075.1 amidohydrolase family protein [Chitinophagaceae bacterium]
MIQKLKLLLLSLFFVANLYAQETYPVNGTTDNRLEVYAFTNATIIQNAQSTLQNATLVIKQGKISGINIPVPKEAVVIDCKGKFIYPSFIDLYSGYGIAMPTNASPTMFFGARQQQFVSNTKGAYNWNQAIKPEINAFQNFQQNETLAKSLRAIGFGTVVSHAQDGIARGTGALVTLGNEKENFELVKEKVATFYSFSKGSSTQDYPGSLMGTIALIRQTYLDAQWYKSNPATEGTNISLQAWNDNLVLPQIFDIGNDKYNALRADKIAKEFGANYILKGTTDLYQRLKEVKETNAAIILPLNFPAPMDVEDPNDARIVALADMKHWEMAPYQPAMFEKANISFALTSSGLGSVNDFLTNLRKAIHNGLSETTALDALTRIPATWINVYDKVGSLEEGKLANFFITNHTIFSDSASIFQNWVQGKKYIVKETGWDNYNGQYIFTINTKGTTHFFEATIKGNTEKPVLTLKPYEDTLSFNPTLTLNNQLVKISWSNKADKGKQNNLSGIIDSDAWAGNGYLANGDVVTWKLYAKKELENNTKANNHFTKQKDTATITIADVVYPFNGYGWKEAPKQEKILIRNVTVWTNEKQGILQNTDVIINKGKIERIGKNIPITLDLSWKIIDGTGKHLTAGIIDEHSHIAITGGVNECTQAVTSEVRIADVISPEDINIYRQLSGGVTSSHLLHGSCNPVGGQSQLIKLRWGKSAEEMKFEGADGFIKFALGENVKSTRNSSNNRYPDTRMGVEQVYMDAFQRAVDYQKLPANKRRDLELDALSEILNKKRFITCHSYVQSEITMLMRVADKFGFTVNTFTHILEGYKVADKMKKHSSYVSTFSDWWAYKMEVQDAIAYNAAIMQKTGLTVAINSDDPEMARRLNQEAAKTIKYGEVNEEEALKMVTLNPAKMLHVDKRVGSIKVGKDADVVLWSEHPLSIYAKSLYTIIDGIIYYDREKDTEQRKQIALEKARLIQKLLIEKKKPANTGRMQAARPRIDEINECEEDHKHNHSIFEREDEF